MIQVAIHGTGRMAKAIATAANGRDDVEIVALAGPKKPEWETGIAWWGTLDELPELPQLLIDFTLPEGTLTATRWCAANKVSLLSGVTGLPADVISELEKTASEVPVLWSPNLSLGVNLLADLAARASLLVDPEVPVVIEDIHHQWKKDAPSGTALMLGQRVAIGRGGDDSAISYHSERVGEVIGEHTVTFRLDGEEFDLVHRAHDRVIYALGALQAGAWLSRQPPGMYSSADWLSGQRTQRTEC